ncbi:MAG: adenylate cyclase [Actinomycetota bacterium]|jgi:class 3 adenylate cyclase|nr:adenylate cyclase [Actinomycetota bacterium]
MDDLLEDERLKGWAKRIEEVNWAALILDAESRVVFISDEARNFVQTDEKTDLGLGLHAVEAFMKPAWLDTVAPESQLQMFQDLMPLMMREYVATGRSLSDVVPEPFTELLEGMQPEDQPLFWVGGFQYLDPKGDGQRPDYRVDVGCVRLNGDDGALVGWIILFFLGAPAHLVSLLARGDVAMYERMADLVDPAPHQAAILFCDLHHSGRLSRRLPSAGYFKLVRRLWTGFDHVVAEEAGIIGKHAGDGASAFFLVDHLESASKAASAAVRASRAIHEISEQVFREVVDSECVMKIGVHWGGSLYMGQLVPGGRLDVTALGDEVNEAARVQETAGPGETLASKHLLEQMLPDDAAALGLDLEKLAYHPLSDAERASEKAIRDAGGLAITTLPE